MLGSRASFVTGGTNFVTSSKRCRPEGEKSLEDSSGAGRPCDEVGLGVFAAVLGLCSEWPIEQDLFQQFCARCPGI